jgi:hypothetical protein
MRLIIEQYLSSRSYRRMDSLSHIIANMARNPSGNSYELQCNDAYFALLAEAVKLHSLRTRRTQNLRKLIEIGLHDEYWRSIPFKVDDIQQLLRSCGKGAITLYVMLPTQEVGLLRQAKTEMQEALGQPLSTLDMFAILLRLSLDVGGAEWAPVV